MVREGSGDPPGRPERADMPSRRACTGQEVLPASQFGLGGPPGGPGGIRTPSLRAGKGLEALTVGKDG